MFSYYGTFFNLKHILILNPYLYLFFSLGIFIFVCLILIVVTFLSSGETSYSVSRSSYECGFIPFEEYSPILNVQFYLVALSFLLFDLEIALILPWSVAFINMTLIGINTMFFFLFFLILGLVYE